MRRRCFGGCRICGLILGCGRVWRTFWGGKEGKGVFGLIIVVVCLVLEGSEGSWCLEG